jgi:hypothetical protein
MLGSQPANVASSTPHPLQYTPPSAVHPHPLLVPLFSSQIFYLELGNSVILKLTFLLQSWKSINLQAVIKFRQNCIKQEVKH